MSILCGLFVLFLVLDIHCTCLQFVLLHLLENNREQVDENVFIMHPKS